MAKIAEEELLVEPILPEIVIEVTQEWADEKALGLPSMYFNGESFAEVCRELGITKDQYRKACKISEKFDAADKYSQVVHEAWWMKQGRDGASGKRINAGIWNHAMNNMYGWSNGGGTESDSKGRTLNLGIVFVNALGDNVSVSGSMDMNTMPKVENSLRLVEGSVFDVEATSVPNDVPIDEPDKDPDDGYKDDEI